MNLVLTAVAVVYVLTCTMQKFNMITILSFVSTGLFMSRKVGHFCKMNTLLGLEFVGLFLDTAYRCIVHRFDWKVFLITLILRAVFIGVAYYDMTVYVYVKEKHRKGENEDV